MRKWIVIAALALLILIPIAVVGVLVHTSYGVQLIAGQLHRLERLGVSIEGLSGTLAGPLKITRFELDRPNVHIVSHDIVAHLEFREALLQTVRVKSLTARDTLVEIRSAPPDPDPKPLRFLPSFMRIKLRGLDLEKVRYVNINGFTVDADRLRGRGRLSPGRLIVSEFQADAPQFNLSGNGELRAQRPLILQLQSAGRLQMHNGTMVAAQAQLSGNTDELGIKVQMQEPNAAAADVKLTRPEDRWRIAGKVTSKVFPLEPWLSRPPFSLRNVELDVDIDPDRVQLAGSIGIPEYDSEDFTISAQGRYSQRVLQVDRAQAHVHDSPVTLHANGTVQFDGEEPTLDVTAQWTDLQWPLRGKAVASSKQGNLTLRGPMPYEYTVVGQVSAPRAAGGQLAAQGELSKEQLSIGEYTLRALNGTVNGAGSLQFKAPQAWTLTARAANIDPAAVNKDFPGRLSFAASAQGRGLNQHADFRLKLASLRGTLRGLSVRGEGSIERQAKTWRVQQAHLGMGDAKLDLNGSLGDTLDAQWTLQARSLDALLPQAHGSIDFSGSAHGPVKTPHLIAELQGRNLRYASWQVADLSLSGNIDLAGAAPSHLALKALRAGRETTLLQSLRINGEGNAEEHRLSVGLTGTHSTGEDAAHADLQIAGRYAAGTWTASVVSSDIRTSNVEDPISLAEPAEIVVSADRASLDSLCLVLGNGRFCVNGKWRRNGPWEGTVAGYELPLAAFLPPSGNQGEYAGRIEGRIHAFGTPGQPWQAEAGLRIVDAAIIYRPQGAEPEVLNLGTGGVAATATYERVEFSLGLQAFTDTFVYANGRIARNGSNDLLHLPLKGDVRMRAADANILPILFPEIDHAAGVLSANADISGSLAAPLIDGRLELAKGEFDSYRVNLALRELNLVADLADSGLDFKGSAHAGDGKLQVNGRFAWRDGVSHGELQLKGQNLLVADLPEYHVVASPDLKFSINGRNLKATGELLIPSARIQPVNLRGAVQVSDDARYVDEHPAEEAGRYIVDSHIRVRMGDDVQIDSFGLQGRIGGGVETIVRTGDQAIGRGELNVIEGRYEAYGQKLGISRGRLLFDTSALDDPGIDVEARRKVDTVEVGLSVRGTLRSPRLTFFSDPSMPQSQIVSYLLVGKSIDSMQSSTATTRSTTDDLALKGGGVLASRLGRTLGLDEVGVESSVSTDGPTPELVLGKFLSPRLFISYGISLTESVNTLKLRYTISDKWVLKTEDGEVQSVDVEYSIQR